MGEKIIKKPFLTILFVAISFYFFIFSVAKADMGGGGSYNSCTWSGSNQLTCTNLQIYDMGVTRTEPSSVTLNVASRSGSYIVLKGGSHFMRIGSNTYYYYTITVSIGNMSTGAKKVWYNGFGGFPTEVTSSRSNVTISGASNANSTGGDGGANLPSQQNPSNPSQKDANGADPSKVATDANGNVTSSATSTTSSSSDPTNYDFGIKDSDNVYSTQKGFVSQIFSGVSCKSADALVCWTKAAYTFSEMAVLILAVGALVAAGIIYMTSAGNPKQVALAKKIIYGALSGVAIIVLGRFFLTQVIGLNIPWL